MNACTVLLIAIASGGTAACSGTAGSGANVRPVTSGVEVDYIKMITVNQWAHQRGATVLWINYPMLPEHRSPADG